MLQHSSDPLGLTEDFQRFNGNSLEDLCVSLDNTTQDNLQVTGVLTSG